jgi:pimeloyl-ACP methyl ester carboxylesterase
MPVRLNKCLPESLGGWIGMCYDLEYRKLITLLLLPRCCSLHLAAIISIEWFGWDRLCISPEPAAEFGTLPSKPFIAASDKKVHQELAVAQAAVTAADAKRAALAKAHDSLMGSTAKRYCKTCF